MRATMLWSVLVCALLGLLGCQTRGTAPPEDRAAAPLAGRIDAAMGRASAFLVARQGADGAWRSGTYGFMKDGASLTPHVGYALFFMPQGGEPARGAFDKAVSNLVGLVGEDGRVRGDVELIYPVYTSAGASWMVGKINKSQRNAKAGQAWLAVLRGHQLAEARGWRREDVEYGGWGFALRPATRPAAGQRRGPWDWSNLTATVYALEALYVGQVPKNDPAYAAALVFVERCQNYGEDPAERDERFDDGGFYFTNAEPMQNKAGVAGTDRQGRVRLNSYGTMTADGLRALLACGLKPDHPRVVAARRWLEKHFRADRNPGTFVAGNEDLRDATYYYWAWAVAHAFMHLKQREIETAGGKVDWAVALAEELLRRQRADGSWANRFTDGREDDPLVATPFATAALAICRQVMSGQAMTLVSGRNNR